MKINKGIRKLQRFENFDGPNPELGSEGITSLPHNHGIINMIRLMGKQTMWFPNRSDTNRPVQSQKIARSLKFLSHLLIAGCDIGVQISVRPFVRSFVRPFVRPSVRQHLRRSLVFSTSEIAASLKPCIVIVPDILFKHAP